jgi:hypothetical protein
VAQMKDYFLMLVPDSADDFRATIGALRSRKWERGHVFTPLNTRKIDKCACCWGERMREADMREKLEALHIQVHAVIQLQSRRWEREAKKDSPLIPHFTVSVAWYHVVVKVRSLTELCSVRVTVLRPEMALQCKRCQRFGHTQCICCYAFKNIACGDTQPPGKCVTLKQQPKCCSCGGSHIANRRSCSKW